MGVTQSGDVLTSNSNVGDYQWLLCSSNYAPLGGETNQSFTATINDFYAVEVRENGCVDTSDCYSVSTVSVFNSSTEQISIIPNPSDGNFSLVNTSIEDVDGVRIFNEAGQLMEKDLYSIRNGNEVSTKLEPGLYFFQFQHNGEQKSIKLVILK